LSDSRSVEMHNSTELLMERRGNTTSFTTCVSQYACKTAKKT